MGDKYRRVNGMGVAWVISSAELMGWGSSLKSRNGFVDMEDGEDRGGELQTGSLLTGLAKLHHRNTMARKSSLRLVMTPTKIILLMCFSRLGR